MGVLAGGVTGGGAVWSPLRERTLRAFYRGDSLSLADAAPITSWPDSSGNGFTLVTTSGGGPIYKTGIVNGQSVARFAAASSQAIGITSTVLAGYFAGATPSVTVGLVSQLVSTGAGARVISAGKSDANNQFHAQEFISPNWVFQRNDDANVSRTVSQASPADSVWGISVWVFDGTTATPYVNGVAGTPTNISGTCTGLNQFALGALYRVAFGNFFGGDIAECTVFNSALNASVVSKYSGYASRRYGIRLAN